MKSITITPLLSKIALFVVVLSIVSISAGALVKAQNGGRSEYAQSGYMNYLKDQCKDGGWESLGFRNQGQCVSYFAKNN